jgi:hypothetical protein
LKRRKNRKLNSRNASKNNESKKSTTMKLSAVKTLQRNLKTRLNRNKNKISIKKNTRQDTTIEMSIVISAASKCSQRLSMVLKRWKSLTPKIKGTRQSTIRVAARVDLNLETSKGGKTNLTSEKSITTEE